MDEDGHLAQVYVSEGVRPCRYRLQLAKDCFYGASSPKIPDITMLRSGHRICYTVIFPRVMGMTSYAPGVKSHTYGLIRNLHDIIHLTKLNTVNTQNR